MLGNSKRRLSFTLVVLGLGTAGAYAFAPVLGIQSWLALFTIRRSVGVVLGLAIGLIGLIYILRPQWILIRFGYYPVRIGSLIVLGLLTLYVFVSVESIVPSALITAGLSLLAWHFLNLPGGRSEPNWKTRIPNTDIASFIYAALFAVVIVTIRVARGFLETPPFQNWGSQIPTFFFTNDPVIAVYNKEHVRLAAIEFVFYYGCGLLLALLIIRCLGRYCPRLLRLHPATALFSHSLFFASFALPPYGVDATHWTVWIGPALDTLSGNWPYLHAQSGYGFLVAGVIAAWISIFPISPFSLALLVFAATAIAGISAYVLFRQITRSPWLSLLLASILLYAFYSLESAVGYPNLGGLRWQMMLATSLLFIWITLSRTGRTAFVAAFMFGLMVLWNPPTQIFPAIAFIAVHLSRWIALRSTRVLAPLGGMLVGTVVPLGLILLSSKGWPPDGIPGIIQRTTATSSVFYNGFGNAPQLLTWAYILWIVVGLASLYLIFRRTQKRSFLLGRDELFLLVCMMTVIPEVLYDLGRSGLSGWNAIAWVMLPPAALVGTRLWRLARRNRKAGVAVPVSVAAMLLFINLNLVALFTTSVSGFVTKYETARFNWSLECGGKISEGKDCDWNRQPSLRQALSDARGPIIPLSNPSTMVLLEGCQNGVPIVSIIDAFIYAYGRCRPQDRNLALVNLIDIAGTNKFVESILHNDVVLVDPDGIYPNVIGFLGYLHRNLRDAGYHQQVIEGTRIIKYSR